MSDLPLEMARVQTHWRSSQPIHTYLHSTPGKHIGETGILSEQIVPHTFPDVKFYYTEM